MSIPVQLTEPLMRRALELALLGQGRVEPNPLVGAVVIDDAGHILGEGWHQQFGGPHAEIHALAAAGDKARGATILLTLEPCCHFGKTPPCTRALIAAGVRRVIVATDDPAPHVNGEGIRELREAGIEVEVGLLEREARRLVAPFVQLMTTGRPWFHAKWAMTLDGKLSSRTGHSRWISNELSRAKSHELRGRMDGILVGIGTVLKDDPLLTARPLGPRVATRIVLDSLARLPLESQLVKTTAEAPVMVVTTPKAPHSQCQALRAAGVEVLCIDVDAGQHPQLQSVAAHLGLRKMTNVLVEGGSEILGAFLDVGLMDEVHAFIAPKLIGGQSAISPIAGSGCDLMSAATLLDSPTIEILGEDVYLHGPLLKPAR